MISFLFIFLLLSMGNCFDIHHLNILHHPHFINDFSKENQQINKSSEILEESEKYEKDSNHILEFTKEIKKMDLKIKTSILKTLWQIVLSDDKSGIFESNLIRRVCGLLYIPDKISGEIKLSLINKNK